MGIINKLRRALTPAAAITDLARYDAPSRTLTGDWQQIGNTTLIPVTDPYDNVFPYVNAISQRFSTLIPYAVDQQGHKLDPQPAPLTALYAPNSTMSCREFLRALATGILTQTHVDVLIWTSDGNQTTYDTPITRDNIVGYTILPTNSRQYTQNRADWYHRTTLLIDDQPQTVEISRQHTISLTYSTHPNDVTIGVSPSQTIRKWASVDDMLADYERGFFANGAVPAGMLGIVSSTPEDYTRNKNRLEDAFRGAGHNNSVVYNWIPIDPTTRRPSDTGKLVWVPFQQSNNTLDLTTLNDVVTERLANALAVPDIIRGIDNGQTYANAQQAERTFIENTLQPLALNIWDKWQFTIDQLTGGLGYGITFDLKLPAQTDIEAQQANITKTKVETLIALVNAGATTSMATRALHLPPEYAQLDLHPQNTTPTTGAESTPTTPTPTTPTTPDPNKTVDGQQQHHQQLAAQYKYPDYTEARALAALMPPTQMMMQRIIRLTQRTTAGLKDDLDAIADQWTADVLPDLEDALRAAAKKNGVSLRKTCEAFAAAHPELPLSVTITGMTAAEWKALYDWDTLPLTVETAYKQHLQNVARTSSRNTQTLVRDILKQAREEDWTRDQLKDALRTHVTESRAELLARNEYVNSHRLGELYMSRDVSNQLGVELDKVWTTSHDSGVCDFCSAMDGTRVELDASYLDKGASLEINGKIYANDYEDMQTAAAHPNCRCYLQYKVRGYDD